jgi:thiamine-phosphate pyrophosphorylase
MAGWKGMGVMNAMGVPKSSDTLRNVEQAAALRIIDANLNRASEGLRVVEEFCRFGQSDAFLARQIKELRHDLSQAARAIEPLNLARSRDTAGDVGTDISTVTEQTRHSLADLVTANWKRVEQALRVIEEYGKLLALDAGGIEQLRYRAYTLGRALTISHSSPQRLETARLYVLINGGGNDDFDEPTYRQRIAGLIEAGVDLIQLRDKSLGDAVLLRRARIVRELTAGSQTLFIMNDRADLAALADADGVHLGQEDLSVPDARRIVGVYRLIGISTHSIEQARQAVLAGADYIGCGPTFRSGTKRFSHFPGLDFLRQIAAEISLPAFAIGGIDAQNLPQVLETGVVRVAVSGAVWSAAHPQRAAADFVATLAQA